jgi:cobalt/nickel transport system ATP-binding protein
MIELIDLAYTYPGAKFPTLDGVSVTLGKDRVGFVGPNGGGKTTLLHAIMGLLFPFGGSILFQGTELKKEKSFHALRRQVGLVFQNASDQLFCPTVLDDVAFGPLNLGLSVDEARERSRQALSAVGLKGYEEKGTHTLSGGEERLLALATVLSMQPKFLFLDEPTNDLSPQMRLRLIQVLRGLPMPYAVVSHDWDFLLQTTDSYQLVENGKVKPCDSAVLHMHKHAHPRGDCAHSHESDMLSPLPSTGGRNL